VIEINKTYGTRSKLQRSLRLKSAKYNNPRHELPTLEAQTRLLSRHVSHPSLFSLAFTQM